MSQEDIEEIKSKISSYKIKNLWGGPSDEKLQAYLDKQIQEGGI